MNAMSLERTYRAVELIWIVGAFVSTLELLACRRDYAPGGMFSWELRRLRLDPDAGPSRRRILDVVFGRAVTGVLLARLLLLALLMLTPAGGWAHALCLAALVADFLLVSWRREWGNDGSDQMSTIVLVALFTGTVPFADRFLQVAALVFVSAQACLAYGTAGVAKVLSPVWRSGEAVALILDTAVYGHSGTARTLQRHVRLNQWLTWSVLAAEVGLAFVLFLPAPWAWALLAWGVSFHIATALMMGLNCFVWAFLATYPAIVFVHGLVWT